jgi:hypothetical protein
VSARNWSVPYRLGSTKLTSHFTWLEPKTQHQFFVLRKTNLTIRNAANWPNTMAVEAPQSHSASAGVVALLPGLIGALIR